MLISREHIINNPFTIIVFSSYSYQSNTAKQCLDTILEIQPKDSSSGGGETRESIVRRMAGEMLEKLPNDYIPHEVECDYDHEIVRVILLCE